MPSRENLALLTDLYQLTMAQAYFRERRMGTATFSLFIRSYPRDRGFFAAAGLQDVLDYLESFSFDRPALDYLKSTALFTDDFLRFLGGLRFAGDVWAIAEGRIFFADEPIMEITAPIIQAQIIETFVINQIHVQSLIATKAARCAFAAQGRPVADFALRRTHGTDAGMKVARASYLAGFTGTSNVMAGRLYGIPIVGTMAHSFVCSFASEIDAFRAYAAAFPKNAILLIDTYDTIRGAHNAVRVAKEMAERGEKLLGVRIDSGDLANQARAVRKIFDDAGLSAVKIIGSGGLDEYDLAAMAEAGAPFDSYGIGTKMGTSADAPWTDMSYKLVEFEARPMLKLSPGKASWPGRKQIFRQRDGKNMLARDVIGLREEQLPGEPLLKEIMRGGKVVSPCPALSEMREGFASEFAALPGGCKAIRNPIPYSVEFSPRLKALRDAAAEKTSHY